MAEDSVQDTSEANWIFLRDLLSREVVMWDGKGSEFSYANGVRDGLAVALAYMGSIDNRVGGKP